MSVEEVGSLKLTNPTQHPKLDPYSQAILSKKMKLEQLYRFNFAFKVDTGLVFEIQGLEWGLGSKG